MIVVILVVAFVSATIFSQYFRNISQNLNPTIGGVGSTTQGTTTFRIIAWWGGTMYNHPNSTNALIPGWATGSDELNFWKSNGAYIAGHVGLGSHSIGYYECGDDWTNTAENNVKAGYNAIVFEAERPVCASDTNYLRTFVQRHPNIVIFVWLASLHNDASFYQYATYLIPEYSYYGIQNIYSTISWAQQTGIASKTLLGVAPALGGYTPEHAMDIIRSSMPESPGVAFFHLKDAYFTQDVRNAIDSYISSASCGGNNLYPDVNGNCRPVPVPTTSTTTTTTTSTTTTSSSTTTTTSTTTSSTTTTTSSTTTSSTTSTTTSTTTTSSTTTTTSSESTSTISSSSISTTETTTETSSENQPPIEYKNILVIFVSIGLLLFLFLFVYQRLMPNKYDMLKKKWSR